MLHQYVTVKCNGDRGMILSSGFLLVGDRANREQPVIQQLMVHLGPPGEATTKVKRLRRARSYMHQYTAEPPTAETIWASVNSKDPYYTFNGLNSTVRYWFRVVALSHDGQPVYRCRLLSGLFNDLFDHCQIIVTGEVVSLRCHR